MKPIHVVIVLIILIILFGASKLPDLARSLGQSAKILKKEMRELQDEDNPTPQAQAQVHPQVQTPVVQQTPAPQQPAAPQQPIVQPQPGTQVPPSVAPPSLYPDASGTLPSNPTGAEGQQPGQQ